MHVFDLKLDYLNGEVEARLESQGTILASARSAVPDLSALAQHSLDGLGMRLGEILVPHEDDMAITFPMQGLGWNNQGPRFLA